METANITYQDEAGNIKVRIDYNKCIACGRCVTACKHDARFFGDDTERFFDDLKNGFPISLIAAPSIKTNIPGYKKLFTYLKQLGVNKIYDVSLGADICIWAHIKNIEQNGNTRIITQPCPVIVTYCELYRHDLLKYLSPVHSPMACISIYMKKYQGIDDRVAALSPCIAKTNEFQDTGLSQYNITFAKLLDYLKSNGTELPEEEADFDHDESGLGSLFPMPGGLKENIEYFLGKKLHIAKAEGFDVYEKLDQYAITPEYFLPDLFDVLNCADGCNLGSAYSHDRNVFEIDKTMNDTRRKATEERRMAYYKSLYKTYDDTFTFSDFIREYQPVLTPFPQLTDDDIRKSFDLLGKTDDAKQHVDCGACGSTTCYDMARKIALGVNIPANCIVKSKDDAKAEHDRNLIAHAQLAEMEKIHEADTRMRVILDATPFSAQIWDKENNFIDCNQATVTLFKLSSKKEFLEHFMDFSPEYQPDGQLSKETVFRYIKQASEKGYLRTEWMHQTLDGELIPCEVTLVRVDHRDEYLITTYVRDLREQKRMMHEIEEAQAKTSAMFKTNELQLTKLSAAVKATKIGLWEVMVVNNDSVNPKNVFSWSDEFRSMLGYSSVIDFPDTFESWYDRLHPDDRNESIETITKHLSDKTGKTPYDVEYRLLRKSGEYAYYRATGETIRDNDGNAVYVAGALMDITETKNIILDSERQRIEAEAANKAKSSFLSTMSHEMRTPMNAIIGMTSIAESTDDATRKNYAIERIKEASKHLLGVINDILDMSKIEADRFELSSVSFNFEKMLQKVADVINIRVDERRQKFFINIGKDIPQTLIGDNQRLAQVITNLLSNAVKFTPKEGTIRLDSELLSEKNGLCRLQISVKDTGIGITDEQKDRLFQSFEQADSDTTRRFGGTGLGLAISKHIVELMNGNIWVESEPEKGSTFSFTVLLKRGEDKRKPLLDENVNWENIRIFAVDDEPEIRAFFATISENLNIVCKVAASGEEAIDLLAREDNYNIYFIDWKLPGMNGVELARQIKAKAAEKSVVIIFSSFDWSVIEHEARDAGVDKFLPKPLFPSIIVDIINECIGTQKIKVLKNSQEHTDDFTGYTILLAEDIAINREIVLSLLEPTGLTIHCAANGVEALKLFKATPDRFDMIFMDLQMPEMDGYDTTRAIRALKTSKSKTIPIIAMTANVFREDVEKCLDAGMNGHVGKPLNMGDVLEQLRNYLVNSEKRING